MAEQKSPAEMLTWEIRAEIERLRKSGASEAKGTRLNDLQVEYTNRIMTDRY